MTEYAVRPGWKAVRAVVGGALLAGAASLFAPSTARAQQTTPHLDRLEVPGAPDDGLVLFRPVTKENAIFYGQLGVGLAVDPLRMGNVIQDSPTLRHSAGNAITYQLATYMSAGIELLDRVTVGATFPSAWGQSGNLPNYSTNVAAPSTYVTSGPAVGDTRVDLRVVVWRDADRNKAVGVQLSAYAPSGNGSLTNYGGDGGNFFTNLLPMVTAEWTPYRWPTFIFNTGLALRPDNAINDPAKKQGNVGGLGVGDEWRWAIGALFPLKDGKFRLGGSIFGQTGLTNDNTVGNTVFNIQNTPIEINLEGRMKLDILDTDHYYVGAGMGTRFTNGYGAPDYRVLAVFGTYFDITDTNPNSPDARARVRQSIRESLKDTDGDGIPDDVDACPEVPEDHKDPDPNDGCPAPSDRDGDGIPDQYDKCPDQPEDKDGVDDSDGCPEDDADGDGIPDAKDACPKEPGQPDPDPKKNGCPKFIHLEGSTVRVLQQVHFATGSATILPDSFPMLQEIVQLLKANPGIKKMRIEGHTDNRGAADMNLDLSKRRAASVRQWLITHGIDATRLESEGYGLTKPIQSNDTDAGRQANRRVEFKITEEDTGGPPKK